MAAGDARWVCCQLGSREHYAVPRALYHEGRLYELIVDAWMRPNNLWRSFPGQFVQRLCERFHPDLVDAPMRHFTGSLVQREVIWRLQGRRGWNLITRRNRWFQRRAAREIRRLREKAASPIVIFAHSYSALEVFRRAKAFGWTTVLGQIDPGEEHFRIVAQACAHAGEYVSQIEHPPDSYFNAWREECSLADLIVVNSDWSRQALERAGICRNKLRVVPLPFEPQGGRPSFHRQYPERFSVNRPLRVLFVGQASVPKGLPVLLEAIDRLRGVPIELRVVGRLGMNLPHRIQERSAIRWMGHLARSEVMCQYREADVLVFPSLSDGFGMAQVEAQGWALPIIASPFCGSVVRDGISGIVVPEVSAAEIAAALAKVADSPELLARFASNAASIDEFGIKRLGTSLLELSPA